MTAKEAYKAALTVCAQQPGDNSRWDDACIGWVNLLLGECRNADNQLRGMRGLQPRRSIPMVELMDEELPIQPELHPAVMYGLCSYLWDEANEAYRAQDYRGRFVTALQENQIAIVGEVIDCYA